MKKLVSTMFLAGLMSNSFALSPKLNTTMTLLKECMSEVSVPLCDAHYDTMVSELKTVGLDPRGEFLGGDFVADGGLDYIGVAVSPLAI